MKFIIVSLLVVIVSMFFSSGIHELGHMIAGILQGWKFEYMIFGPLKIYKIDERIKVGFEKNMMMWGGVSYCTPKEKSEKNIKVYRNILLAGPLLSIFLGILALLYVLCTMSIDVMFTTIINNTFKLFLFVFGLQSIAMGIISIIPLPIPTGLLYVDGYRFYRLLKYDKEEVAIFLLVEKEMFKEDITSFEEIAVLTESKSLNIRYMGYDCAIDLYKKKGDIEKEEYYKNLKEEIKTKVSPLLR
ncbi:MAG: site-2 protease family protein [Lachnospiraceae bacterium]|nr:site-2 protease family protein [Lachnospiraceae bacterium]